MPSYDRSGNLSRQFTDSEREVDGRLAATLAAPMVSGATGASVGQTYDWMREDMALRSKMGDNLQQEQGMAYAQSARGALNQQAIDQEQDDAAALGAMKKIRGLVDQGLNLNEAKAQVMDEDSGLYLNDRLKDLTKDNELNFETDKARQLREGKQALEFLNLGNDKYNAEVTDRFHRDHPEAAEAMSKILADELKARGHTAENALPAARLAAYNTSKGLREAEEVQKTWEIRNEDDLSLVQEAMENGGLGGLVDPAKTVGKYGKIRGVAGVLSDTRWRDRNLQSPEDRKKLVDALNTENDDAADPKAREAARSHIRSLGGKYLRTTADAAKWNADQTALQELGKEMQTDYEGVSKEITGMVDQEGTAPLIVAAARGFVSQAAGDPSLAPIVKEYHGYFKDLEEVKKPAEAAAKVRDLMANFASKVRETRATAALDPKLVEAAAKEVAPPAGKMPAVGEVRGGYTFKGGNPADKANWTK